MTNRSLRPDGEARTRQRAYWNGVADVKQFTTPFQADIFTRLVPRDAAVVDVGCGYGRTLAELRDAGYTRLLGLDFSERLIARGRALHPDIEFRVQTASSLELPDASHDAVLLFAVLTCLVDDADQRGLLAEIRRVLKPGGLLYINDFLLNSDARNRERYARYPDKTRAHGCFVLPEGAELRHHDEAWIQELLSGFETLIWQTTEYPTMNGHRSNGFYWFGRKPVR